MKTVFYVTATNKFLSGWGTAEGKINKLVVTCENMAQAEEVQAALRDRGDMKYINIRTSKPAYSPARYVISSYVYDEDAMFKIKKGGEAK